MTYTDDYGYSEYTSDARVAEGPRRPGFARLLGDCARMAPHWAVPAGPRPVRVAPSQIHGISVPLGLGAADRRHRRVRGPVREPDKGTGCASVPSHPHQAGRNR